MCGQVHPQPRGQYRTVRSATSPSTSTSAGHRLGAVALWRRRPCGRERRCAQVHARVRTDIDVESPTPAALGTGEWVQSSVRLRHHARHGHVRTRPRALAHRRRRPPAFNRGFKAHPPVKEPWGQPGTTPGTTTVVLTAQATRRAAQVRRRRTPSRRGHHAHGARDHAPHPLGLRALCAGGCARSHERRDYGRGCQLKQHRRHVVCRDARRPPPAGLGAQSLTTKEHPLAVLSLPPGRSKDGRQRVCHTTTRQSLHLSQQ